MQTTLPFKSLYKTLNIWTWNINCIKNKEHLVYHLLKKHDIDILLLTETKLIENDDIVLFDGYISLFNSNKTCHYHGVAFIYKSHLTMSLLNYVLPHHEVIDDIEDDIMNGHYMEGRILVLKCEINHKTLILVGTYVPNSGVNKNHPLKRLTYRTLSWDKDLYKYLAALELEYKHVIWLGDLNVIIKDNDSYHIKTNIAGTTIEERTNIKEFMVNWIDTWDIKNKIKSCRSRATWGIHTRNPLRLDYVICSKSLKNNIVCARHDQCFEGSDHYPTGTTFRI